MRLREEGEGSDARARAVSGARATRNRERSGSAGQDGPRDARQAGERAGPGVALLAGPSRVGPRGKEREEWAGAGLTWAGFWVLAGFPFPKLLFFYF